MISQNESPILIDLNTVWKSLVHTAIKRIFHPTALHNHLCTETARIEAIQHEPPIVAAAAAAATTARIQGHDPSMHRQPIGHAVIQGWDSTKAIP